MKKMKYIYFFKVKNDARNLAALPIPLVVFEYSF